MIVSPESYILTNNHVVRGAGRIEIRMAAGTSLSMRLAGFDPAIDLALLHAGTTDLSCVSLGDSGKLVVALAENQTVEVVSVNRSSPAGRAGLRPGDLIVAINETGVTCVDDLHRFLTSWPIAEPATLVVIRNGQRITLPVTPAEAAACATAG